MLWLTGDIWKYHRGGRVIVIPTNAGWKHNGENVMGRGLALDAAKMYPYLPMAYGMACMVNEVYGYFRPERLILIPSKKLNEKKPQLSWKQPSDIFTITESLMWLEDHAAEFPDLVYVPLLGAGNGGLEETISIDLMEKILKNHIFIGVIPDKRKKSSLPTTKKKCHY